MKKKYDDMSREDLEARVAILEKEKGKSKGKRKGEEYFTGKYPDVDIIPGSLRFLTDENKQAVDIRCNHEDDTGQICGEVRTVRTSDLHQVDKCKDHMATGKKDRKKAKQAALETELAEAKAQLAELTGDTEEEEEELDE